MSAARIPFLDLRPADDSAEVHAAIARVVDRGWFVLGPEVDAFEREFAAAAGARSAVGVGSGTDALALALRAVGVGPGDDVVTTPLSAAYTALAIVMAGARPVFADVDPERLTIDPESVEQALTPRSVALLPVHLYGQPADMRALTAIAQIVKGLALIEDCCQAHLATCEGQPVGTFGQAAAFSSIDKESRRARRRRRRDHERYGAGGPHQAPAQWRPDRPLPHVELGVNSRLDELQAAVLRARLPLLRGGQSSGAHRTAVPNAARAAPVNVVREFDPGHVYHLFPVRSPRRAALQERLRHAGIETLVHYPLAIPQQPAFAPLGQTECPHALRAAAEVLSLPLYPTLTPEAVATVASAVRKDYA